MSTWIRILLCLMVLAHLGCDGGILPDRREVVYFTPLEVDVPKTILIPDVAPDLLPDQKRAYDPIIDSFDKNHERLLESEDIKAQVERLENIYVVSGKYLDLLAIYEADYRKKGLKSYTVDRLAWGYIRLGQQKSASELVAKLKAANPDDPTPYFLEGTVNLQWDADSEESKKALLAAWTRVLELDPNFSSFEQINARDIETQLQRVRTQLQQTPQPVQVAPKPEDVEAAEEEPLTRAIELAKEKIEQAPRLVQALIAAMDSPAEATPKPNQDEKYRTAVARGEIYLAQGKLQEAETAFVRAMTFKPNGFGAEFGQLKAAWNVEQARNKVIARLRALGKRDDLSADEAYQLGVFAYSRMADHTFAKDLLLRVQKLDPAFAKEVSVDELLKKL